ncbi:MAG: 50S ribosomal protein L24 [Patescibacteria group bacterium]|nr:50S ribosomal protein L24 [Patescibacteria group bacterium]
MKIKKGDTIIIMKGKDRDKKAKVLKTFSKENKILADGINIKKVRKRPKKEGEKGQMIALAYPFPVAKAKLICPKCGVPSRVGYKVNDKTKVRVCKKCKAEI